MVTGSTTMFFYYDSSNSPVSVSYNGEMYYYIKNLQGDIVKIIDQSGTEAAEYKYDALGTITDSESSSDNDIAALNPLRYRGYVYDEETGLYYLQSRYYDSFTGRFLNADDTTYIGASGTVLSGNIFTYCKNNPNSYIDKFGTFAMAAVATVTVTNWWNPIGWIGAILWTVAIVCVIYTCVELGMKNGKALPQLSKKKD